MVDIDIETLRRMVAHRKSGKDKKPRNKSGAYWRRQRKLAEYEITNPRWANGSLRGRTALQIRTERKG